MWVLTNTEKPDHFGAKNPQFLNLDNVDRIYCINKSGGRNDVTPDYAIYALRQGKKEEPTLLLKTNDDQELRKAWGYLKECFRKGELADLTDRQNWE